MAGRNRKALVWLRNDLRLRDNPALNFAAETYDEVYVCYLYAPSEEGEWAQGGASRWWLHHSLASLSHDIEEHGGRLGLFTTGSSLKTLRELVAKHELSGVFWNRRYERHACARDEIIKKTLGDSGLEVKSFNAQLLWEPWEITTGEGKPYQVYTPFWNKVSALDEPARPRPLSEKIRWARMDGLKLTSLELLPKIAWTQGFSDRFRPGEAGAHLSLKKFVHDALDTYKVGRDEPALSATSTLSAPLHFGEVSVRELWHAVRAREEKTSKVTGVAESRLTYRKELVWREFAYHLLFHFPQTSTEPLRESFENFPWRKAPKELEAWQKGLTGYPIVDAGLRELWHTGFMHNRVRMIVASFLVKDLRISWLEGAKWFWDTLVDADLASNTLGWQWAGGCGADAAPYFRVFNPTLQGEKFDEDGAYVKRWVPELALVPATWIHKPWEASVEVLSRAGVTLGKNYPKPMVDHKKARDAALAALAEMKARTSAKA
ncbi:MAG: deoxyribodipyrimidine photo-lyase [Bdellovibrionota bacterium]